MTEPRDIPHLSDVVVYSAKLITMRSAEHEDLLNAKKNVLRLAYAAVALTLSTLAATFITAVVDPTSESINVLLWLFSQKPTLLGLGSGTLAAGLFYEYYKLDRAAAKVSNKISQVYRLLLAFVASEAMEDSEKRDAARARLAKKLLSIQSPLDDDHFTEHSSKITLW